MVWKDDGTKNNRYFVRKSSLDLFYLLIVKALNCNTAGNVSSVAFSYLMIPSALTLLLVYFIVSSSTFDVDGNHKNIYKGTMVIYIYVCNFSILFKNVKEQLWKSFRNFKYMPCRT